MELVIPIIKQFVAHNYNICELDEKLATSVTNSTMRIRIEELFSQILGFEIEWSIRLCKELATSIAQKMTKFRDEFGVLVRRAQVWFK